MQIKSFSVPAAIIELRFCQGIMTIITNEIGSDDCHRIVARKTSGSPMEITREVVLAENYCWKPPINSSTRLLCDDRFVFFQQLPLTVVEDFGIDYSNLQVVSLQNPCNRARVIKLAEDMAPQQSLGACGYSSEDIGGDHNKISLDFKHRILLSMDNFTIKYMAYIKHNNFLTF